MRIGNEPIIFVLHERGDVSLHPHNLVVPGYCSLHISARFKHDHTMYDYQTQLSTVRSLFRGITTKKTNTQKRFPTKEGFRKNQPTDEQRDKTEGLTNGQQGGNAA